MRIVRLSTLCSKTKNLFKPYHLLPVKLYWVLEKQLFQIDGDGTIQMIKDGNVPHVNNVCQDETFINTAPSLLGVLSDKIYRLKLVLILIVF